MNNQEAITINVMVDGEEQVISTFSNEYRSLMALINDRLYSDGFGECGGMGRCGSCLIVITSHTDSITRLDRNEKETIRRMNISNPDLQLSCQIVIDHNLDGCNVVVMGING